METLNILPINDIQQHKEDEHCMCNPATRVHCGVKIVTHNAFDGRDIDEYKKDAERYRYLRNRAKEDVFNNNGKDAGVWIDCTEEDGTLVLITGEDADEAIDLAMKAK